MKKVGSVGSLFGSDSTTRLNQNDPDSKFKTLNAIPRLKKEKKRKSPAKDVDNFILYSNVLRIV